MDSMTWRRQATYLRVSVALVVLSTVRFQAQAWRPGRPNAPCMKQYAVQVCIPRISSRQPGTWKILGRLGIWISRVFPGIDHELGEGSYWESGTSNALPVWLQYMEIWG